MTLEEFRRSIESLVRRKDFITTIVSSLQQQGIYLDIIDSPSLEDEVINLLEYIFDDKSEWIKYWVYELDSGKENDRLKVYEKDIEVPLTTIEDLYNILTKKD